MIGLSVPGIILAQAQADVGADTPLAPAPDAAARAFEPFSLTHFLTVGVLILLAAAVFAIGRRGRVRSPIITRRAELVAGFALLALWMYQVTWWFLPAQFDPQKSYPLHLCDLTGLIAPLALITLYRPLRTLLYFWGLTFTPQAFITPTLDFAPTQIGFYLFWGTHSAILGTALYDVIVRRYRPTWCDFTFALAAAFAYFIIILGVNLTFNLNYGYVGRTQPDTVTIIDALGPWPWRLISIVALAIAMLALVKVPWDIARLFQRPQEASVATDHDQQS